MDRTSTTRRTTIPGMRPQYDDRYRVAPPPAGDYDGDHYYADDGHMPPQGEDGAAPSRRRGGLLTIAAVLGLAVIGTAGAFGYRAFTSGPGGSANPPVIKADTTPAKIVPPAAAPADAQGKPFQERIGTATTERIVPREEQPVSLPVPPQPRPGAPQTAFAPTGAPPLVAPPPSTRARRIQRAEAREDPDDPSGHDERRDRDGATAGQFGARARRRSESRSGPMAIAPQSEPRRAPRRRRGRRLPPRAGPMWCRSARRDPRPRRSRPIARCSRNIRPCSAGASRTSAASISATRAASATARRSASFATLEQANTFCGNLKDAGGQCIVQQN